MDAVVLDQVSKQIRGREVLRNISLRLEAGKAYGFYGHNGSGKSMLFRAVSGLIRPTSGTVTVFGKQIGTDLSFPENIGLIIENVGFWPYYTGFENLKALASIRRTCSDDEIIRTIRKVGLDPDDKRFYSKYSLGMKQRLGLAQAIMEKPRLLLLDEPTNALDEDGISLFQHIIREELEKGTTVLMTSHHKDELRASCCRIYRMQDGTIAEEAEDIRNEV